MAYGSQSMVAPLRRVIVKRPQNAYRNPESIASQWQKLAYTAPPDLVRAAKEHERFVSLLGDAEVLYLEEAAETGLDSIYTHDPALITDAGAVIFQTGKVARRGEGAALAAALTRWNIPILGTVDGLGTAEGGDFVWLDQQTLIAGRGFRTNAAGIAALRTLLYNYNIRIIPVDLPYWTGPADCLHLMSFISLPDADLAVVYKRLLPVQLYELLQEREIQMIEIPKEEYATQACNILAIAPRKLVMLAGNPRTREKLLAAGCEVHEFEGAEISLKGSGGPTCLTRPLWRS